MVSISTPSLHQAENIPKVRVYGFVDGFNLYHAMENFRHARTPGEEYKYKKYKWLCLQSLLKRFVNTATEELVGVEYFTAYPGWNRAKEARHKTYVSALIHTGVHVTFGEFKLKQITCRGICRQQFETYEEKQTDVNISTALIEFADRFDKAILLTEDSDQVPAVRLFKKLNPSKKIFTLPPIGRGSKELMRVCDGRFTMDESALASSQLPSLIEIKRAGNSSVFISKPPEWSEAVSLSLAATGVD